MQKKKIILASASPRRRELLKEVGLEFDVAVSCAEEIFAENDPGYTVSENARLKATAVSAHEDVAVIGADTMVSFGGRIFGKPENEEDAFRMLKLLSGNTHEVYTGVTVLCGGKAYSGTEITKVTFRTLSDGEIREYIATGDPLDKAGAYGMQSRGGFFVKSIEGDWSNVVGLPLALLHGLLLQSGCISYPRGDNLN